MKYIILLLLMSCSTPIKKCLTSVKVNEIIKVSYGVTHVGFDDGKVRVFTKPISLKVNDYHCIERVNIQAR